jgi:hypothetical protein
MLVLDHINGINNDYRMDNLRLQCPNCHSQTPTFSGRNRRTSPHRVRAPHPNSHAPVMGS